MSLVIQGLPEYEINKNKNKNIPEEILEIIATCQSLTANDSPRPGTNGDTERIRGKTIGSVSRGKFPV